MAAFSQPTVDSQEVALSRVKWLCLVAFAGCSDTPTEPPNPNPPPSWGVPITGGTMLISRDQKRAVIADPDRDRMLSVDLHDAANIIEVPLNANDEPGRLIEDGAGRIHVALRRGDTIVTFTDAATLQLAYSRPVCGEPRGLAWDSATDLIHVACTSGELVSMPAAGGAETRHLQLDRDLRDVIVQGTSLVVTRFKNAEVLTIDATGAITSRVQPPIVQRGFGEPSPDGLPSDAIPTVAWRTIALPDGRLVMSHQRQRRGQLHTSQGGYGGDCGEGPVEDAITVIPPGGAPQAVNPIVSGALPVDVAVNATGDTLAFVTAGSNTLHRVPVAALATPDEDPCGMGGGDDGEDDKLGAPTSVGWAGNDLVAYYPELPALVIHLAGGAKTVTLPGQFGYDAGRSLFHRQTSIRLACASCHPEGREDGLVWNFDTEGQRRTQMLAGNILQRAPYHWTGDMVDLPTLMDRVFAERMNGPAPNESEKRMLPMWLDRIPAPKPAPIADTAAVARGQALFESTDTGCTTCHSGPLLSTRALVNVGTQGIFKVPSLVGVGARAPFMHDGCAATLTDRFGTCGGGDLHGHTSQLTDPQKADLVAFLSSL
jgi:hypothetical protein